MPTKNPSSFAPDVLSTSEARSNKLALRDRSSAWPPTATAASPRAPESLKSASISPPLRPNIFMAAAACCAGSSMPPMALLMASNCLSGDSREISATDKPNISKPCCASFPPCPASTMAFCILLIDGPTFSAPTPARSNAICKMRRSPAATPVRADNSDNAPPASIAFFIPIAIAPAAAVAAAKPAVMAVNPTDPSFPREA